MKYIITTIGTSAIEKAEINVDNYRNQSYDYFDNRPEDLKQNVDELYEKYKKLKDIDLKNNLQSTSAEIKSLYKLGVNEDTFNYLICSDTAECRICTEFLKKFIEEKFESQSSILKIDGLKVDNSQDFQTKGLKNLGKEVLKILDELTHENRINENNPVIFNLTGGYKATIPYLTIFAMLYKIPICYIYEDTDEIIEIPPVPINYDFEFIKNNVETFVEIEANTAISRLPQNISNINKKIYFQQEGNSFTTSYFGDIMWEKYKQQNSPSPPREDNHQRPINLGNINHHGRNRLMEIARKIINSPYVKEIINSSNNEPQRRHQKVIPLKKDQTIQYIQQPQEGICLVIDYQSDEGFSMLVKTTGRIFWETQFIAEELKNI